MENDYQLRQDKMYCFPEEKQKTNKIQFHVRNKILDTVTQYVYLGISINNSGSFINTFTLLKDKAIRAIHALSNKNKITLFHVKTAVKLFDACILPILSYGAEIWATFQGYDFDSWDISVKYIKYRRKFLDFMLSKYPYLSNLDRESQYISIISKKDPTSCPVLAKYIFQLKKEREYILSQST